MLNFSFPDFNEFYWELKGAERETEQELVRLHCYKKFMKKKEKRKILNHKNELQHSHENNSTTFYEHTARLSNFYPKALSVPKASKCYATLILTEEYNKKKIPFHIFILLNQSHNSQTYQITIFSHLIKYANHNSFIPSPKLSHKMYF